MNKKIPNPNDSTSLDAGGLAENAGGLAERLESLESQIGRLTDFLTQQDQSHTRRRRKLTLRLMFILIAVFACVFAWFSTVYRQSRQQARAVDHLVVENVYVTYEPRRSFLVSLLPGDVNSPPDVLASSLGTDFFRAVTNVSTNTHSFQASTDKQALIDSISSINQLERLRLSRFILNTPDLLPLSSLSHLQSLDLSHTRLDNGSMPWLADTQMRWFAATHTLLGDQILKDLSRCPELQYLNMERTTVTDNGLQHILAMKQLRYLNLKRCSVSYQAIKKLSDAMPSCVIDWEPLILTSNGKVNYPLIRQRSVRFGGSSIVDPRASHRAIAPSDNRSRRAFSFPSAQINRQTNGSVTVNNQSYRPGYILDAF